jgi:glutamyl-tRNA synthetase
VDDAQMRITEVVRGDDLLASTPRQIALYRALGEEPPRFLHVPLVLGPDGERLAKRHGAIAIADLRDRGATPEEIIGRLAHGAGLLAEERPLRARDLIEAFDLSVLRREPSTLDAS